MTEKIMDTQFTKIVATVGPASRSYEVLRQLVMEGVNVFRLNFSHGTHPQHEEVIRLIRQVNEELGTHVGILADLQGPKLRVGRILDDSMPIHPGDLLTFTSEDCLGTPEKIYMSYEGFARDVRPGEKVLVDDGKIVLEVVETDGSDLVRLKVLFGHELRSNKGVNLPDTRVSLPSLTEKDIRDLDFILSQPVDWIALSFVRSPEDLQDLRVRIEARHHPAKIIAKIEKPEAVRQIDQIVRASNAIMIARGDLAVEVPMERMPLIQKDIINLCIQWGRPVIVATQMMESMVTNPSPTRAEITDVANAVLDGADALMLSGETAVGDHPAQVIRTMNAIITEVEKRYSIQGRQPFPSPKSSTFLSDAVCFNAAKLAQEVGARAIVGMTTSGYTAFKVSSYRPMCKIYIFSEQEQILSTLNLVWGVHCYYYDRFTSTDDTIRDSIEVLKRDQRVKPGDVIINTASMPLHARLRTNMIKVSVVD
ncbi:MAG: pyruvate kinase [Saprospiraceae bacterium]|nr:pyruvate kinase [Saprospiraceae bacterium]